MDCPSAPNRFRGLLLMMPPCFPALRLDPDDAGIATPRSTSPLHSEPHATSRPERSNIQSEFWRYVPPKFLSTRRSRTETRVFGGWAAEAAGVSRTLPEPKCKGCTRNAKSADARSTNARSTAFRTRLSREASERHRVAKKMLQNACRIRRCTSDCIHLNGLLPSAATAHTFRMRAYAALSAGGSFFWIPSRCWISCQKETNYGISISGRQRPGSFRPELWHDDARRRRTLSGDGQCAGGRGAPPGRNLRRGGRESLRHRRHLFARQVRRSPRPSVGRSPKGHRPGDERLRPSRSRHQQSRTLPPSYHRSLRGQPAPPRHGLHRPLSGPQLRLADTA